MAAAAAVLAHRRASEKRRQAQQAAEDAKSFVKDTLERFDKDNSGHHLSHPPRTQLGAASELCVLLRVKERSDVCWYSV
jgi:hypothetical protein